MGLTRLAIARPVVILMMVAAFLVLGLVAFFRMPAELNPNVDLPRITVVTQYTGTNPTEMETLITKPIEDAIAGVSGIQQITSHSELGTSVVQIQFYFGTDLDAAASDTIQKMQAIRNQLPTQAGSPSVIKADTSGQPIMHVAMQSKYRSIPELASLATNIVQPQLEQATDVGQVNIAQSSTREIDVNVPTSKLAAYGITVTDLANAIAAANINVATGFIQSGNQYYNVRLIGEFASVDEIRNLRVTLSTGNASGETQGNGGSAGGGGGAATAGGASGSASGPISVNLNDIAQVIDTGSTPTQSSDVNGIPAIGIDILKTTDGNTVAAADSVKQQIKTLAKLLPSDVTFTITTDQSDRVHDNINDVVASLAIGAILAVLIVFIFLHNPRGTIIVAIAIPTSMIATFGPIYMFGFTLNTMTLLGLSLAVGILVDDSIVVLENINRHLSLGEEPVVAAINGRSEIGYAALTLTAVDLVVFLPIAFMGGVVGQFFRSFGLTVAVATLFSMFVSFTLTPMMAARWYQKGERLEYDAGFAGWFDRRFLRLEHWYQGVLRGALRHPWAVVIIGTLALVLIFKFVGGQLGFRFAPDQDQNQVTALVQCPPGSSLAYTQNVTNQIERAVHITRDLRYDTQFITTTIGNAGPGLNENGTQYGHVDLTLYNRHTALDYVTNVFHGLGRMFGMDIPPSLDVRTRPDTEVAAALNKVVRHIPGAIIQASNVSGFGGGAPPLEVDLMGPDFNQLARDAQQVQKMVGAVPGAYNVQNSFQNSVPEVDVRLDRQKAADMNISLGAIGNALADSIAGNINSEFRDPATGNQYYIRVQLPPYARSDPQQIADIIVAYQNGAPVYLGDIAQVETTVGPVKIDRFDRQREIAITAYMRPGFAPGNASILLNKELSDMDLGQVTYTFGGESRSIQQEGGFLLTAFLLGIILTYMLMAALFNNMVYPLSIMLSVPQAWAGAMIALFLAHETLSLISMIGIVLLNAVVNKSAILVVDYTNTLRSRGYKRLDALLEACPIRLRPIMMTTLTIIVSTLPTALALGQGAGFRQSLGVGVEGGICLSLILSLIMVPCAYLLFDNFTNWLGRRVLHRQIPAEALDYTGADAPASRGDGDGRGSSSRTPGDGPPAAEPVRQEDEREPLD